MYRSEIQDTCMGNVLSIFFICSKAINHGLEVHSMTPYNVMLTKFIDENTRGTIHDVRVVLWFKFNKC
jgi:hypothetical protein